MLKTDLEMTKDNHVMLLETGVGSTLKTPAYAAASARAPLGPFTIERRQPGPREVLIDILYCGVCHSDIHQARDEWGGAIFPMVPGHEIVGKVVKTGGEVKKWQVGDTVGVGCFVNSCRECNACMAGEEQYCERGPNFTYNSYERDGRTPTYGGYSTRITVDENYILRIPKGIPLEGAAPLLCAGITTYSPLCHFGVKAGDEVAVVGLGGLGHVGVKFAKALGASVTVLSHSPGKRADALRLGADDLVATRDTEIFQKYAGRFDLILDTVSAQHDYNSYLNLLRLDGTMVLVGLPDPAPIAAFSLITRRRRLAGSMIGGIRETQEMLEFCAKHGIVSDVEVIPIQRINEAFERAVNGDVRYRFVIDIASLEGASKWQQSKLRRFDLGPGPIHGYASGAFCNASECVDISAHLRLFLTMIDSHGQAPREHPHACTAGARSARHSDSSSLQARWFSVASF